MKLDCRLLSNMVIKGILGFALLGLLLFGSAGSIAYPGAWMFIATLFILMLGMGLILLFKHPKTLEGRLKTKESEPAQKLYILMGSTSFLASFILAGLDYRFGWSAVPPRVSAAALAVMVAGYIMYAAVTLQNAYASRVIEIQEDQALISSGMYSIVRHPMYLSSLILFLAVPFVLGSYISLVPMLLFPAALVLRIRNEESVLINGLEGYCEYMEKTRYRLIPFIW